MDLEQKADIKCPKCKTYRYQKDFLNDKNRILKTCKRCREISIKSRNKNKCEHDKRRNRCKECGGSEICQHNRQRSQCKKCGGSQICEHKKIRSQCKECGGSQICEHDKRRSQCKKCKDPIKLTIKTMIKCSKGSDKKYNRYDANNFIDKCFLEGLVEEYPNCYYNDCKVELQYIKYQDDLATIERLDNSIGHIKSNCVICCFKCNIMRKSNR